MAALACVQHDDWRRRGEGGSLETRTDFVQRPAAEKMDHKLLNDWV